MVAFVDVYSPRGTSETVSYEGEAQFVKADASVHWTAHLSTANGKVTLRGVAVEVSSADLAKSVAMQAVRDALDRRYASMADGTQDIGG